MSCKFIGVTKDRDIPVFNISPEELSYYQSRVVLKKDFMDNVRGVEIKEWAESSCIGDVGAFRFIGIAEFLKNKPWASRKYNTMALYFTDENDKIMFKLSYHEICDEIYDKETCKDLKPLDINKVRELVKKKRGI